MTSIWPHFLSFFLAKAIDFVKSQLQTEAGRAKYSGGMEAALDIVKHDGPFALYRGVGVQVGDCL